MLKKIGLGAALAAACLGGTASVRAAEGIEVLHQWTSGGEAFALQSIKDALARRDITWSDTAVAGGGGSNEKQALQARFAAGNPPAATALQPQDIPAYSEQGALRDMDAAAAQGKWSEVVSPELVPYMKADGHFVAAPIDEHRENMLWINQKLLQQVGGKAPTTWDEFDALADKFKAAGVVPLAMGGEDWQEAELFSDILLGTMGQDFFRASVIDLKPEVLSGPDMVKVFERFRKELGYTDTNRAGRDWNVATQMVIGGKAGMQVMGDWAKGEFAVAKMVPGQDYACVSTPGSGPKFVFLSDFFAFFKQQNASVRKVQDDLASVVMEPDVQKTFNLRKGAIPPRVDVDASGFDTCAQNTLADRKADAANGGMVPSFIENTAIRPSARSALLDVITQFANTPSLSAKDAAAKLGAAVKDL